MIETQRLLIRKPKMEDLELILPIQNSEYVQKYNAMSLYTPERFATVLQQKVEDDSTWYLVCKETDAVIGEISIEEDIFRYGVKSCCLSYFLCQEATKKGYMTEALVAFLSHLFEEEAMDCIAARVFSPNGESIALLQKLGFTQEGCLRQCVRVRDDVIHDDLIFSLLAEEWKNRKKD